MAEANTPAPPEGGGTDEYRCQVIDPGLTKTAFLTGTQFAPENVAIAHVYGVDLRNLADGYRTAQTPEERLT